MRGTQPLAESRHALAELRRDPIRGELRDGALDGRQIRNGDAHVIKSERARSELFVG